MASQVEVDPQETREWLEALDAVVASDGPQLHRMPTPAGRSPYDPRAVWGRLNVGPMPRQPRGGCADPMRIFPE